MTTVSGKYWLNPVLGLKSGAADAGGARAHPPHSALPHGGMCPPRLYSSPAASKGSRYCETRAAQGLAPLHMLHISRCCRCEHMQRGLRCASQASSPLMLTQLGPLHLVDRVEPAVVRAALRAADDCWHTHHARLLDCLTHGFFHRHSRQPLTSRDVTALHLSPTHVACAKGTSCITDVQPRCCLTCVANDAGASFDTVASERVLCMAAGVHKAARFRM